MSTRCNIKLKLGKSVVWIYRHSDGYLSGAGADIAEKLLAAWGPKDAHRSPEGAADKFLRAIFAEQYEATGYCGHAAATRSQKAGTGCSAMACRTINF